MSDMIDFELRRAKICNLSASISCTSVSCSMSRKGDVGLQLRGQQS